MKRWLILDVHNLCWRCWHVNTHLSFKGQSTSVVFLFFKSLSYLKDELASDRVAFCFDHPYAARRKFFPAYKANRRKQELTKDEAQVRSDMSRQIAKLRLHWLPMVGFKNIFYREGMEADDLMASLALNLSKEDEAVLITSDADLWQCLRSNVSVYDPGRRRLLTRDSFKRDRGYSPKHWAMVKALCGCHTDNVPGIPGIGEITAEKYILETLGKKTAAWIRIHSYEGQEIIRRNQRLTTLPLEGCPDISRRLVEDEVDEKAWRQACIELGFRSMAAHPPIATKKLRQMELNV